MHSITVEGKSGDSPMLSTTNALHYMVFITRRTGGHYNTVKKFFHICNSFHHWLKTSSYNLNLC